MGDLVCGSGKGTFVVCLNGLIIVCPVLCDLVTLNQSIVMSLIFVCGIFFGSPFDRPMIF